MPFTALVSLPPESTEDICMRLTASSLGNILHCETNSWLFVLSVKWEIRFKERQVLFKPAL